MGNQLEADGGAYGLLRSFCEVFRAGYTSLYCKLLTS